MYTGQLIDDLPHGLGELEYTNKDKYVGNFIQGRREGEAKYFYSEGTMFSGRWQNDHKTEGELVLFNGDVFRG